MSRFKTGQSEPGGNFKQNTALNGSADEICEKVHTAATHKNNKDDKIFTVTVTIFALFLILLVSFQSVSRFNL